MADTPPQYLKATRGPFVGGYTSSVPPFMAGPDQLVGNEDATDSTSSRNCFIDPFTGGVSKRPGCIVVGDTLDVDDLSTNGIINGSWGAKSRRLLALDSPSMADSYPTHAVLYSEDTNAGFPTTDSGFPGTIYVRSTNGADSNYSLLQEFGTTHYKTGVSGAYTTADFNLKVVPIWVDSGDGVYTRGALTGTAGTDKFLQQLLACGSRSVLQTQSWLYAPNLRATPWRWNKRLNESTSSGSEVVRIFPTGPFSPLFPPRYDSTRLPSPANGSTWVSGDTFYISCVFKFEDGSYSRPFVPRAVNATLSGGLGLVTVDAVGNSNKYPFIAYQNVPIGPEGTVARVILRTPKQNRTAATDTITISPLDLRVCGVMNNNTQTLFLDYNGDDDSLVEDDDVVRFDLVCPRRARYIGTGDQRALISYTLPNTAAIMLALVNVNGGGANNYDQNVRDTETSGTTPYNSSAALVRITSSQLELHYNAAAAPDFTATTGNAKAFAFATYDTLDKLVDAINTTTTSSECKQWAAQLAPGIDGTMLSTNLTKTTLDIAVTGTSSTTLTGAAADILTIGVGMEVSGTSVTDGTYVVAKPTATTLTISTATTGVPGATTTFHQETGDNAVVTGTTRGYLRAFGPAVPVLLHVKPSAIPNYDKPDKQSVYYTNASPGAVSSGISLAPNAWLADNRLVPHNSPRQQMQRACQGIVDVEGAAVVAYTDGIYLFRNVRGGNTGEDFDCRLFTINDGRGCISYLGLVSGNGWAAYATTEGIMATDKNGREFVISQDIFNPHNDTGDIAYEILTSAASAASDSDDQYLSMAVIGHELAVAFRISASNDPRVIFYDYSPGIEASGVEELIDPDNKHPYIWSPPAIYNENVGLGTIGAMGSVRNASGRLDYICYDTNSGTNDGRVDRINYSAAVTDNGTGYEARAVAAPVLATEFHRLKPQRVEVTHVSVSSSPTQLRFANDQVPTFSTSLARVLNSDDLRTKFQKQVSPIDQKQRGATDCFWMQWRSTTSIASVADKVWRVVLEYEETEVLTGVPDLA